MFRTLAIGTLLLVGGVSVAQADVYRWVDEHSSVHYSDRWVPGSVLIKTTKPHPSSSDGTHASKASRVSNDQIAAQLAEQSAAKAVKQDMAKARERQCKEAKERYEKAIQARRIYKPVAGDKSKDTDRPDDREYMSEEEADAYRVKARTDVQELCDKADK